MLQQLKAQTNNTEILEFIDKQINARLKGNNPDYPVPSQIEVEHVVDYLNDQATRYKLKLRRASYESIKAKAELWIESLIKKAEGVVETEEDTEIVRTWDSGFRLVKLVGKAAFEREGALMRHCVGSYYTREGTMVYSLRDSNNNPHCTIEVVGDTTETVQQIKGKGNGSIHPKYIKYVLDILKDFRGEVRDSELSNLGYDTLSEDLWRLYDNLYKPVKYLTFNNKRFFYKNQKPKLKISHEDAVAWLKENKA